MPVPGTHSLPRWRILDTGPSFGCQEHRMHIDYHGWPMKSVDPMAHMANNLVVLSSGTVVPCLETMSAVPALDVGTRRMPTGTVLKASHACSLAGTTLLVGSRPRDRFRFGLTAPSADCAHHRSQNSFAEARGTVPES